MPLVTVKNVGTVGSMTLVSRVTGLVRDIAFAQFLGSGALADAFFVAFRIPNFFRRVFGEGALSVAFELYSHCLCYALACFRCVGGLFGLYVF